MRIRTEMRSDASAIRELNDAAFGGDAEGRLIDALRKNGDVELSLVAERRDQIVGHILFSSVTIETDAGNVAALSLAPMAVRPGLQRQGIGTQLIESGINQCRSSGHHIIVVLGHPDFYPRFGFEAKLAQRLESPFGGGEAWMALELVPGALTNVVGRVVFAAAFGDLE